MQEDLVAIVRWLVWVLAYREGYSPLVIEVARKEVVEDGEADFWRNTHQCGGCVIVCHGVEWECGCFQDALIRKMHVVHSACLRSAGRGFSRAADGIEN